MKDNIFKRLVNNNDSSVNSKIVYSGITMLLVVALIVGSFLGIGIQVEILLSLLGFILSLLGISSFTGKNL